MAVSEDIDAIDIAQPQNSVLGSHFGETGAGIGSRNCCQRKVLPIRIDNGARLLWTRLLWTPSTQWQGSVENSTYPGDPPKEP